MTHIRKWSFNLVATFAVAGLTTLAAFASEALTPGQIAMAEMDRFVAAYVEIQELRRDAIGGITGADATEMKSQVSESAEARTEEILRSHGFTPKRYNAILASVNANPEMRESVLARIEKKRGD